MNQWKTPILSIGFLILTASIGVTGCAGAAYSGNQLDSPDSVTSNQGLSAEQNRPVGHSEGKRTWTNGEQTVSMDEEHRRVIIFLTGLIPLQKNQSFDTTTNPIRLLVKVPAGWLVNCGIPMRSSYVVSMVPTDMRLNTGVSRVQTVEDGVRYGPILQTTHPGIYNLVILQPGQKGGHVIDVVEITSSGSPSVTPI